MKTAGIRLKETGGPDCMVWADVELSPPGPDEVQLLQLAAGLNFIDVYHRTGLYPLELPTGLGVEGCGTVQAVGANVADIEVGDRVAYVCESELDGYALSRNIPAQRAVVLDASIEDDVGASMLLKGMTAWFLLHRSFVIKEGDSALVHSAAGGVGLLLTRWATAMGAKVIGTAGTAEKRRLARDAGCTDVLDSRSTNLSAELKKVTRGEGVRVVYDAVGKATFQASLDCLEPHGTLVTYGNASGPPPMVNPLDLAARGSLKLTRPRLFDFIASDSEYRAAAASVVRRVTDGTLRLHVGQRFAMAQASSAHIALEARETIGATVLTP